MSVTAKRMQMRVTRPAMLCVLIVGLGSQAAAGPLDWLSDPVLRGSQTVQPVRPNYQPGKPVYPRWDGFYLGGQIGRSFGTADFSNATRSQISYILANTELQDNVSNWTTLPKGSSTNTTFGGFIGYNTQWDEAILGVELNYNHIGARMAVQDSIGPLLVAGGTQSDGTTVQYRVVVASQAAVALHDAMTARARFGWAASDRLMPYAFAGIAVGRAEVSRSANVTVSKALTPPPIDIGGGVLVPQPQGPFNPVTLPRNPQTESRNVFAYGYTAGLGVDVGITANTFLRAEWEWTDFASLKDVKLQLNNVHVGLGVRF